MEIYSPHHFCLVIFPALIAQVVAVMQALKFIAVLAVLYFTMSVCPQPYDGCGLKILLMSDINDGCEKKIF